MASAEIDTCFGGSGGSNSLMNMPDLDIGDSSSSNRNYSQVLFLDFETELADILGRNSRSPSISSSSSSPSSRRDSESTTSNELEMVRGRVVGVGAGAEYDSDGMLPCSRINYNVLCSVTGRSSLTGLTKLSLCVKSLSPAFDNLSLLSHHTPRITTLTLDHSRFESLRVLGDELPNLRTLSACNCGLTDLDGVQNAPALTTLVAADNAITHILPVTELRRMETLDLENNFIDSLDSVSFLFLCPKLEYLILKGNPISYMHDYRTFIFRILPELKSLDVVTTPRVQIELCRRTRRGSKSGGGDDNGGAGAGQALVKEEGKGENEEETKEEEEETEPVKEDSSCARDHDGKNLCKPKDKLICQLMRQTSIRRPAKSDIDAVQEKVTKIQEDENETPKSLSTILNTEESSNNNEETKDSQQESPDISTSSQASSSRKEFDDLPTPTSVGGGKLLDRRKSLEPTKIPTKCPDDEVREKVKLGSNLGMLMLRDQNQASGRRGSEASSSIMFRPDSSASQASTSTMTISENSSSNADSGIDDKFRGPRRDSLPPVLKKPRSKKSITFEDEEERKAKQGRHVGVAKENADLKGKTTKAGDIEIEDYDVELDEEY